MNGGLGIQLPTHAPLVDETLETPTVLLAVGTPIGLSISLRAFSNIDAETDVFGSSFVSLQSLLNFFDTLSFPISGPVFILPPGFTINSAQADIVNNRFVGGRGGTLVPEPASLALLSVGLFGLMAVRRRRHGSATENPGRTLRTAVPAMLATRASVAGIIQGFLLHRGRAQLP